MVCFAIKSNCNINLIREIKKFGLGADVVSMGELIVALKAGVTKEKKEIISECVKMVREKVGPVAAFKIAIVVKRLPKTRSGKVLRGTVRKIADN